MPARQTKGLDSNGGNGSRPLQSCRKERRPMAFMFIDSSNGGINAKPDREVRSFVMKSARNKKPWSTRPRSSKTETLTGEKPRRLSPSRTQGSNEPPQNIAPLPQLEWDPYSAPWVKHPVTSPRSSRSNSVFSSHSSNWACESPVSTSTSPCVGSDHAEEVYDSLHPTLLGMACQTSLNVSLTGSFDCLAVRLNADAEGLLHQFIEASTPRLLPIDPHKSSEAAATDWFATCIQSPIGAPFIYATLTSSARVAKLDPEVYKWRAISEVNMLLTDSNKNTDDTTIATVFMLLALEEASLADPRRKGDERRWSKSVNEAHLSGLRTMIGQRGGLAALGQNRCLQVFILMHSIAQSITTFKPPYALLIDADGQIQDYRSISLQSPNSFTRILRPFQNLSIGRALFDIVSTITIFVSDLTAWYESGICPVDSFELQKHASLLMYRLFDWYEQNARYQDQSATLVDQSICLALLIFMVNATEPNALSFGSRLSKTVTKLRKSLQRVPLLRWTNAPDILLWTLTMGALGAKGLPKGSRATSSAESELSFFTQYSYTAFLGHDNSVASTDLELLLEKMRTCLWIPSIFDVRVKRLWESMGLCKAEVWEWEELSSSSEGDKDQVVDDEYALGQSTTLRFFSAGGGKTRPMRGTT
ncbi:uncharacterized protein K460DRAFT_359066 [Cucurbitaria berberidis CBS 394.84]|uniref:Transcription factor domain-containing protein n=1 Tax=Cucurbitaria berberidis CBS 394.84 TaxID=1168544 RepID=A0A9P4GAZ3_9PLEO|nr:uncharacterized protein K460DRAFT_359066 [Cucurbitaria berberidis CBS 394.84]KAF1842458.1 hypothetical protein K460DRAFT_359066 [Cucurbitaria berberidis CBS 394.84]